MKTALVRKPYAGWCGGTAARAASYPINRMQGTQLAERRRGNIKPRSGEMIVFGALAALFFTTNQIENLIFT